MAKQVNYFSRIVGGQNLGITRPIFGENDKLFVPYENTIISFSTKSSTSKQLKNQCLSLKDNHDHANERISSICLHPISSDFQIFSFTKNGFVFILNYEDSSLIKEYDLKLDELELENPELVWATVKCFYFEGSHHLIIYFTIKYTINNKRLFKLYVTSIDNLDFKQELISLKVFDEKRISFGRNFNYLIVIDKVQIYYIGLKNGFKIDQLRTINSKKRQQSKDKLQIVCCNPVKDTIAYTCRDGVIRLLTIDSKGNLIKDTKARLHWHQMQITDMCFSTNGVYLYSVGYESVVVRWNLESSFAKNFISNVGYSIKFISCDESNNNIAITLHNNEIRLISSYFDCVSTSLNNLTYIYKKPIETGLIYDPKHDSIILNDKPGFLQFYSPLNEENQLRLDVASTRYILKAKDSIDDNDVINIDVFRVAVSDCGNWLVTYEMRDDKTTELETRLKFWRYLKYSNLKKSFKHKTNNNNNNNLDDNYEVNTCINLPHKSIINEMKFSRDSIYLITTSKDHSFKIWINNKDSFNWYCFFTYNFQNDLIPNHISTSFDSSMFAINYDNLITLWNAKDLNNIKYIDTLKNDFNSEDDQNNYLALEFGTGMMSHLLSSCTNKKLIVWNVSKCEIKWSFEFENEIKQMIYNKSTKNLLTIDLDGNLDVFSINSNDGNPLYRLNVDNQITKKINYILFINQSNYKYKQLDDIFGDQMLCFMTTDKRLFILENEKTKENREKFKLKNEIIKSTAIESRGKKAISQFVQELIDLKTNQLKSQSNESTALKSRSIQFNNEKCNLNKLIDEMFYNVPSHVLPPIQMIAKPFLRSILNVQSTNETSNNIISVNNDVEMNDLENEELGNKLNSNLNETKIELNSKIDLFSNDKITKKNLFIKNEDYSFLNVNK